MGGEGPYVDFVPHRSLWSRTAGLPALSDEELSAAYARAHPFLLEKVAQLKDVYGWQDMEDDEGHSVAIEQGEGSSQKMPKKLLLPQAFLEFIASSEEKQWGAMFKAYDGRRPMKWSSDLYIEADPPAADIFYVLQCIAPGMLPIIRVDEIDDFGEEEITRFLPRPRWVRDNRAMLTTVLGDSRLTAISESAEHIHCQRTAYRYDDDFARRSESPQDFTACDKECGYCGRCPY